MIKSITKYGNHTASISLTGKKLTILQLFKLLTVTTLPNKHNKLDITKDHIQTIHTHAYMV